MKVIRNIVDINLNDMVLLPMRHIIKETIMTKKLSDNLQETDKDKEDIKYTTKKDIFPIVN